LDAVGKAVEEAVVGAAAEPPRRKLSAMRSTRSIATRTESTSMLGGGGDGGRGGAFSLNQATPTARRTMALIVRRAKIADVGSPSVSKNATSST
jgi:hypothetical protein